MAKQTVAKFGKSGDIISHEEPAFTVFHIPPDTDPANHVCCDASVGSTMIDLVLPPTFPGPRFIHGKVTVVDFKEASKLEPSESAFWMSMGICNFKMKEYENTVSNMDAILQKNTNNAEAHVLQGRAYSHLAEVKKAIDAFDAALKADERSGEAYLHRGRLKAAAGASGCSDLKKAQSLNANGAEQFVKKYCN